MFLTWPAFPITVSFNQNHQPKTNSHPRPNISTMPSSATVTLFQTLDVESLDFGNQLPGDAVAKVKSQPDFQQGFFGQKLEDPKTWVLATGLFAPIFLGIMLPSHDILTTHIQNGHPPLQQSSASPASRIMSGLKRHLFISLTRLC